MGAGTETKAARAEAVMEGKNGLSLKKNLDQENTTKTVGQKR